MMTNPFVYDDAFSRNLGLVTQAEQDRLRKAHVAIIGMGGVGGSHLLTLVRLGITRFSIVDFDSFEQPNFNRQIGASMATLGRRKVDVMAEMARAINPDLELRIQVSALAPEDFSTFLHDVDVVVDGLDFFVLDIRARLYDYCASREIPFVSVGPMGLTSAWFVWTPGTMSPSRYFRWDQARTTEQKALHFLLGLSPRLLQSSHIVDMTRVNFKAQSGPSLAPACMACSAIAASETLKLLLKRGKIRSLPWTHQFDMLNQKTSHFYNVFGLSSPLNRLKLRVIAKKLDVSLD